MEYKNVGVNTNNVQQTPVEAKKQKNEEIKENNTKQGLFENSDNTNEYNDILSRLESAQKELITLKSNMDVFSYKDYEPDFDSVISDLNLPEKKYKTEEKDFDNLLGTENIKVFPSYITSSEVFG